MSSAPPPPLHMLTEFFRCAYEQEIPYCYWKSTHALERALGGKTDLDLLVDRRYAQPFRQLLSQFDFQTLRSPAHRQFPALEDYLGFDALTGNLAHLHVHYRLVLGQEFVKNYSLPLERAFLEHTRLLHGVPVPIVELELIVLALRLTLKYRDRDLLKDTVKLGRAGIPAASQLEFQALRAETNDERILRALEKHVPFITRAWMQNFLDTIERAPRNAAAWFALRDELRAALEPYRRLDEWRAARMFWSASISQNLPHARNGAQVEKRKIPNTGGVVIALVGADGAGKSTMVKALSRWLGWRLNVRTFYMGTTHPSFPTKIARGISNTTALPHAGLRRVLGKGNPLTNAAAQAETLATAWRCYAEARDRYSAYCEGLSSAARGCVVIFDRYPLPHARLLGRSMDGPRITTLTGPKSGRLLKKLARAEEAVYRKILPPENLMILHVSPAVSQARKPDHDAERIYAKSRALLELEACGMNVMKIDADQPLDAVLLEIKKQVWHLL